VITRFVRNPYVIALLSIAIVATIGAAWSLATLVDKRGFGFSAEQLWQARLFQLLQGVPVPATMTAVAALLAVLVIGSVTQQRDHDVLDSEAQRATRTTSAAGSARNLAATTVPNSSPSISNSSDAPSISMSTERPRE
jgi:hypothetical protein